MTKRGFLLPSPGTLTAAALLSFNAASAADAQAADRIGVAAALNKAGRQRMLSQRATKAWLMIGQGIAPERGATILTDSLSLFETQLAELKGFAPNDEVRQALGQLERDWQTCKAAFAAVPRLENAGALYEANETVQATAHRLTLAYEKAAPLPAYRLVNMAGRQRMLSQRLAKMYLFRNWGVHARAAEMELNMARAEFASGMYQLSVSLYTTPEIKAALAELNREWEPYQQALAAARAAAPIMDMSERVLAAAERLVALYEKQAGATRPE
jgi:nitrate/nitrite-specific signal transduction histidine kinase